MCIVQMIIGAIIGCLISTFYCFIKESKKGMDRIHGRPLKFWYYWLLCHMSYSCRKYSWGWNNYYKYLNKILSTGFNLYGQKLKK